MDLQKAVNIKSTTMNSCKSLINVAVKTEHPMILQQLEAHFIRLIKNNIYCNTSDTLHI